MYIAARNLLELEVSGDVGGDEDVGQLARGHEELGDEVDVPVVETAIFLPRLLALVEVAILLEELRCMLSQYGTEGICQSVKIIPSRGSQKPPRCVTSTSVSSNAI